MRAIVAAVLFLIALVFELSSLGFGSLSALVFITAGLLCLALQLAGVAPGSVAPASRRRSHTPDACPGQARWSQEPGSSSESFSPVSRTPALVLHRHADVPVQYQSRDEPGNVNAVGVGQ